MKQQLLTLSFGIGALILAGTQAFAQNVPTNCASREKIITTLANRFGETRQSIGLGANNAVIEIFASDQTGTWTIIVTMASGKTCLVASGQAYEQVAEALPAKGSDT